MCCFVAHGRMRPGEHIIPKTVKILVCYLMHFARGTPDALGYVKRVCLRPSATWLASDVVRVVIVTSFEFCSYRMSLSAAGEPAPSSTIRAAGLAKTPPAGSKLIPPHIFLEPISRRDSPNLLSTCLLFLTKGRLFAATEPSTRKMSKIYLHYDGDLGPDHTFIRRQENGAPFTGRSLGEALVGFVQSYNKKHPAAYNAGAHGTAVLVCSHEYVGVLLLVQGGC